VNLSSLSSRKTNNINILNNDKFIKNYLEQASRYCLIIRKIILLWMALFKRKKYYKIKKSILSKKNVLIIKGIK
jgi:hypothetical protein